MGFEQQLGPGRYGSRKAATDTPNSVPEEGPGAKLLITVEEAATALSISRAQAYALVRQGRLPSVRLGERAVRVPVAQLHQWIAKGGTDSEVEGEPVPHARNKVGASSKQWREILARVFLRVADFVEPGDQS